MGNFYWPISSLLAVFLALLSLLMTFSSVKIEHVLHLCKIFSISSNSVLFYYFHHFTEIIMWSCIMSNFFIEFLNILIIVIFIFLSNGLSSESGSDNLFVFWESFYICFLFCIFLINFYQQLVIFIFFKFFICFGKLV